MLRIKQISPLSFQDFHIAKRSIHRKGNYYDLLGITPKATQSDIKKAFYKLSMEFHPDKATGDGIKFREISAAYEVLGNLKLRRLYDKGYFPGASSSSSQNPGEKTEADSFREEFSARSNEEGKKWTPPTGKTSAYDYDEWTRRHYTEAFTRRNLHPQRRRNQFEWTEFNFSRNFDQGHETTGDKIAWTFGFFLLLTLGYQTTLMNWDRPTRSRKPPPED